MAETNCPMCGRHCPREYLSCGRGMAYFARQEEAQGGAPAPEHPQGGPRDARDIADMPAEEAALTLLRRCGHYLHHQAGGNADAKQLLAGLSEGEKLQLIVLLTKLTGSWQ